MKWIVGAIALILASGAQANPSVFVRNSEGWGWWLTPMESRVLGGEAGAISTDDLNIFIAETVTYYQYSVCSLESVQHDTYLGIDREAQAQINVTLQGRVWSLNVDAPDSRGIVAQSVIFEGCGVDDPRGAAILVTDAATNEIMSFIPMGYRYGNDGTEHPIWTAFLNPREGDELFSFSSCTECGALTAVYFDVTRQKIYTEYNGH